MNYEEMIEFIGKEGGKLPEGEPYHGIPQSFIDEDKRQWKIFFKFLKSDKFKELVEKIKNEQT